MLKELQLIFRFLVAINADKMYAIKQNYGIIFYFVGFFCGLSASWG